MMFPLRALFFCLIMLATAISGSFFYILSHHTVDFTALAQYRPGRPSILLDDEGKEWGRFALDRREPISLEHMPLHLRNAFIAAEDWRFFSHAGISWKGIARSLLVNTLHIKKMQGASTITQQLVKLLFFDSQKTFKRKIKEQVYAVLVEQQFTKEQILETYLNHVYFGCGIYGVEAASQRFWNKHAGQLTLDESATLAAIIRLPGSYCPILYPLSCQRRRNIILNSMKKIGFISASEYATALKQPIVIQESENSLFAAHIKELIRMQLEEEIGKELLYTRGLTIQTTLNQHMQQLAEKSFMEHLTQLKKTIAPEIDGGLLSIECKTGAVKALVGGFDFMQSKFNRAWQAKRQIGSVFKPLVYAAAVADGASFAATEIDEPITIEQHGALWQPNNFNNRFDGQMTLAYGLIRSNNIVSIKTLLKTGIDPVVTLARACHLEGPLHPYPSLALGCIDGSIREVAGMFNIFANNGIYVEPYCIAWVKDEWGVKLWKRNAIPEMVMPTTISGKVAKVLEHGIKRWRKAYEQELIADAVICKTGTTNDCRTCWFAGSTTQFTTVVYVGCDDNRPMNDAYPIKTAFPIWLGLHAQLPKTGASFNYDAKLIPVHINQWTGYSTSPDDPDGVEIFA